jgi:ABC-type uncharacterized transport system auxiliary subunit
MNGHDTIAVIARGKHMEHDAYANRARRSCTAAGRLVRLALACASTMAVSACTVFDRDAPTASHFLLAPPTQAKVDGASLGSVLVRGASAVRPFDAQGFVYRLSNGQWRVDAYNGFLASPPDMVTEALTKALAASGRFSVVADAGLGTQTDLTLESVVQEFYADFTDRAAPIAVVQLRTYLLDRRTGRGEVLRQLDGKASEPLVDGSPKAVVDALSKATAEAIAGIVKQLPATPDALRGGAR